MKHSKLSPSASPRWMGKPLGEWRGEFQWEEVCSGSLQFAGCESPESEFSADGTDAHELNESSWMLDVDPAELTDDEEKANASRVFLDELRRVVTEDPAAKVCLERRIIHPEIPEFGGTIDCLVVHEDRLTIIDYKYGVGNVVEVEWNLQLLCYAVLACSWPMKVCPVELVVVQPRRSHPDGPVRRWTAEPEDIRAVYERVKEVANRQNNELNAGDHCQFCPGLANGCPEVHKLAMEASKADPVPATGDRLAEVLDSAKGIRHYLNAAEKQAKAHIQGGGKIPGFKLVKSFKHRAYIKEKTEQQILAMCRKAGFKKAEVTTPAKLKTPKQLEAVVGSELVAEITERPLNGYALVPESDRRQAATFSNLDSLLNEIEDL
jgi:hypothetical protein